MSKPEYNTIRDLERKNSGHFIKLGAALIVGIILALFGSGTILQVLGIAVVVISFALIFVLMIWMVRLQKEPVRHLYCPYCASKNDVFLSRKEFACDICGRRVAVSPSGQPIPIEPIEDDEDDE